MTFKLKETPEDFIVSEVISLSPSDKGDYSLYSLKKRDLSTWDALGIIAKKWHIPLKYFGYGGLKDKRSLSFQYITIKNGPKKDLKEKNFELTYLGKTSRPLDKKDLLGNYFEITVREVTVSKETIEKNKEEIAKYGIPNYFDDQRFGSVGEGGEFAVKEIIKGNYERALYLLLTQSSYEDISKARALMDCLKSNWRNFGECVKFAKLSWIKNLLEFLATHKPSQRTFKRALHLVDKEYLFFLGNVYQSYLWNEVLKKTLEYLNLAHFSISSVVGELYFYTEIPSKEIGDFLRTLRIPFPSPKVILENFDLLPLKDIYLEVIKREGIEDLKKLRTFIKGLIFKTYPRPAICFPEHLKLEFLDQQTAKVKFFLEKGSYATLVIKRLFYADKDS